MENKDVHALQYTPRPSTSLEVVRTLQSARPALSLLSLPLRALCLVSHFDDLPLAMSQSPGTGNQPGGTSQNPLTQPGNVRDPGSSAGGGIPAANAGQGDNPAQV